MDQCARCGHTLGVGRFCVNCGHPRAGTAASGTPTVPPGPPPPEGPTQIAPPTQAPWGPATPPVPPVPPASPVPPPPRATAPPPAYQTPPGARYPMYADEQPAAVPGVPPAWEAAGAPAPPPHGPPPRERRTGAVWAVVAVAIALVVVGVVGVLLLVNGTGDDTDPPVADGPARADDPDPGSVPPSTPPSTEPGPVETEPGQAGSTDPATVGDPEDLAAAATPLVPDTAQPSTSVTGQRVRYDAANLLDGRADTAWRAPGDLSGTTLVFTLPEQAVLTEVGLVNGYAKVDPGYDGYTANRRVLEVEWVFDDGTVVPQQLGDSRELQTVEVDAVTTTVRLRLLEVSPPARGDQGRDYTAISEVSLVGAPTA